MVFPGDLQEILAAICTTGDDLGIEIEAEMAID